MRQAGEAQCSLGTQPMLLWSPEQRQPARPLAKVGRNHPMASLRLPGSPCGRLGVHTPFAPRPLGLFAPARRSQAPRQPPAAVTPCHLSRPGLPDWRGHLWRRRGALSAAAYPGPQWRASGKRKASHRPLSGDPKLLYVPVNATCAQSLAGCMRGRRVSHAPRPAVTHTLPAPFRAREQSEGQEDKPSAC